MLADPSTYFRFLCYGLFGVACEVVFTAARRGTRDDWRQLWSRVIYMLPIYGLAVFVVEPIHDATRGASFLTRGTIYTLALFACELASGWLLRLVTGRCPWDYSGLRWNFMGLIRWSYAPLWFAYCLALEHVHDGLV
jgi:hypothetical protein